MKKLTTLLVLGLAFSACQDSEFTNQPRDLQQKELSITIPEALLNFQPSSNSRASVELKDLMNQTLFAETPWRISEIHAFRKLDPSTKVETLDRQFESTLPYRWVPGDENRNWNGDGDLNDIDWVSFTPFAVANGSIDTEPVYRAMYSKWETEGNCKTVDIDENIYDFSMGNPSLILDFGLPGFGPIADVSVVGFLPAFVFEEVLGEENILGVAFAFIFVDENGNPVKTTRGKEDKAYTEVWFNDGFPWAFEPSPDAVDLESVILHEFGHTLNLGHFGILQSFEYDDGTFKYVYRPVNTMNAFYIGEARDFLGPNDKGNFCEAWGSWPWN